MANYRPKDKRDKKYRISVEMGTDSQGMRKRKVVSGVTHREAQSKAAKLRTLLDRGMALNTTRVTVTQYLERWLEQSESRVGPSTLNRYAQVVRRNITPSIGTVPLAKLNAHHIESLLSDIHDKGLAPLTVLKVYRVLSQSLKYAQRHDMIAINPCSKVDAPKAELREAPALNYSELAVVLDLLKGSPFRSAFIIGAFTGMRRGEICGLAWGDVDLDVKTLKVTHTLQRIEGQGMITLPPKTKRSRRTIELDDNLVYYLKSLRGEQLAQRRALGLELGEEDYVCSYPDGKPFLPDTLTRVFKRILQRLGINEKSISMHILRHTHISLLLKENIPIPTVSARAGHAKVSTTLNIYAHTLPGMDREAADKFGEALNEALTKTSIQRTHIGNR